MGFRYIARLNRLVTQGAAISALMAALGIAQVHAVDGVSVVKVSAAGEAYDGAPSFELRLNGTVVGSGVVNAAVDSTRGPLPVNGDVSSYLQQFEFKLPAGLLRPDSSFEIVFTNDAWGGPGSSQDRNLFLESIEVNGRKVFAKDIELQPIADQASSRGFKTENGLVALVDQSSVAIAAPGAEGWPEPKPQPEPRPASAASTGPETTDAKCDVEVHVTDFALRSASVPVEGKAALELLSAKLAEGACAVTIQGFASTRGNAQFNRELADRRARSVLSYLLRLGAPESLLSMAPGEVSSEFGDAQKSNRRVVLKTKVKG